MELDSNFPFPTTVKDSTLVIDSTSSTDGRELWPRNE